MPDINSVKGFGNGGMQQAPDVSLREEMRERAKVSEEQAQVHRKQSEMHRLQAEQHERVLKATYRALEILDPPEKDNYAEESVGSVGWAQAPDAR